MLLELPSDVLVKCFLNVKWGTVCTYAQASSKLHRELCKESLWRHLFERRWGVNAASCGHGSECCCRFDDKAGWTPVQRTTAGNHWRTAFRQLHECYASFDA